MPELNTALDAIRLWSGGSPDLCVAEDLSGYDDSVTLSTVAACSQKLMIPLAEEAVRMGLLTAEEVQLIAATEEYLLRAEILTPPTSGLGSVGAQLMDRAGGIVSGHRLTSFFGSLINLARIRYLTREAGVKARAVVFGDDTVVVFASRQDREKYEKALATRQERLGFKSTVAPDVSFLMKRAFGGYGYVGRMLISTLQREVGSEPTNVHVAALGICARRKILEGHPAAWVFDHFLSSSNKCGDRLAGAYALAKSVGFDPRVILPGAIALTSADKLERLLEPFLRSGLTREVSLEALEQLVETSAYARVTEINEAASQLTLKDAARVVRAASPMFE